MRRLATWLIGIVGVLLLGVAALVVVLHRADIPYDVLERKYATPDSRFIDVSEGIRAHYRDSGNPTGPTLLLIHGFGASLDTWQAWRPSLQGRYRLLAVDLPGHGLTRASGFNPTVAANATFVGGFLNALGVEHAVVAGHSFGGAVAWNLAAMDPHRVDRLILIDASGWEWSHAASAPIGVIRLLGNPLFRKVDKTAFVRHSLTAAYFDKARATDAMIERYVELSRAPGHRDILDATLVRSMSGEDPTIQATASKLNALHVPTLILWGRQDAVVSVDDAQRFAGAIAGSTVMTYEKAGHMLHEEASRQSAADLDGWLSSAHFDPVDFGRARSTNRQGDERDALPDVHQAHREVPQ